MPSPNVDLVRSIVAEWQRGDWSSAAWAHPDIESVIEDGPAPGHWTGLSGMSAATRDAISVFENFRVEVGEERELDDQRVLVLYRFGGRGKTSGLDLEAMQDEGAFVFHVRGGQVTKFVMYWDRERALADLGLAPEAGSAGP